MRFLAASGGCKDLNSGFCVGGMFILCLLQVLQEGEVKNEEITGTSCHSVDQVVKLGSKEVEQLVEIDMEEVREVLAEEITGTSCHSVAQVEKLGSKAE